MCTTHLQQCRLMLGLYLRSSPYHSVLKWIVSVGHCVGGLLDRTIPPVTLSCVAPLIIPTKSTAHIPSATKAVARFDVRARAGNRHKTSRIINSDQCYNGNHSPEYANGDPGRRLVPTALDGDQIDLRHRMNISLLSDVRRSSQNLPVSSIIVRRSKKIPLLCASGP